MSVAVEWVWAVDVAMGHQAFAFAPLDNAPIEIESILTASDAREGERLGLLDRQVRIFAQQLAPRYPPACVWVEQPSGKFIKPQLYYAVGVIQAALFETLGCPVWTMPSGTWKKRTVGAGNASKAHVAAWVAERATVRDQDEADAYAIAAAGRAMFSTGLWSATAA